MRPSDTTIPSAQEHGHYSAESLTHRLRDHADLHDGLAGTGDEEQAQWAKDLRTAADEIEKLQGQLDELKVRIENSPRAVIGTGLNINIDTKDRGKASNMIGNRVRIVSMSEGGSLAE